MELLVMYCVTCWVLLRLAMAGAFIAAVLFYAYLKLKASKVEPLELKCEPDGPEEQAESVRIVITIILSYRESNPKYYGLAGREIKEMSRSFDYVCHQDARNEPCYQDSMLFDLIYSFPRKPSASVFVQGKERVFVNIKECQGYQLHEQILEAIDEIKMEP